MTRTIKFRVWEEIEKVMHEVIEVSFREDREGVIVPGDSLTGARHVSLAYDNKLMQYTGLKDKNGKEIFEGDILKWGHNFFNYEVGYNEDKACFGFGVFPPRPFYEMRGGSEFEVIGNIYENPDLLKED